MEVKCMELKNTKRIRPIPYNSEDRVLLENVGRRIHHLRIERKLTQNKLAEMAGLHKNFICIVEKGSQNPSLLCLHHMSKALDISLSELFGGNYGK